MKFRDEHTHPLPLIGGRVQAQRLVIPPEVVRGIKSYRHACRLAWKLRHPRITQQVLAELVGELYRSHVSDYFSIHPLTSKGKPRRELPARHIAVVCAALGNTVIPQYQAHQAHLTVLEEVQAARRAA